MFVESPLFKITQIFQIIIHLCIYVIPILIVIALILIIRHFYKKNKE